MKVYTHYTDGRTPVLSDSLSVGVAVNTAKRISMAEDTVSVCELLWNGHIVASYRGGIERIA